MWSSLRTPDGAADPEVHHDRMSAEKENVFRLDVSMNHVVTVSIPQCPGHLPSDGDGIFDRQLALPVDPGPERSRRERYGIT